MGSTRIALFNLDEEVLAVFQVDKSIGDDQDVKLTLREQYKGCLKSIGIAADDVGIIWYFDDGSYNWSCNPKWQNLFRHGRMSDPQSKFTTEIDCPEYR